MNRHRVGRPRSAVLLSTLLWAMVAPGLAFGDENARPSAPPPILEVLLGGGMTSRTWQYTGALADSFPTLQLGRPPNYSLPAAPRFTGEIRSFPWAALTEGPWAYLGADVSLGLTAPTVSHSRAAVYDQEGGALGLGVFYRLAIDEFFLEPRLGYAAERFIFRAQDQSPAPVPSMAYGSLELGFNGGIQVGGISLSVGYSVRPALNLSTAPGFVASSEWFPNARGTAMTVRTQAAYDLSSLFTLEAAVIGSQAGLNFNPVSTDAPPERVAGGATDRNITMLLNLKARLPKRAESTPSDSFDF